LTTNLRDKFSRHILQAALLIVAAFGLLVALGLVARADNPTRTVEPGQCAGAHGWVAYEDGRPVTTYSVADDSCPEAVGP
jgi:hypothetical protein